MCAMAAGEKKSGGGKVVLVGTYKGDQLTKWRGWYNYPISDSDFSRVEHVERVDGRAGSPLPAAPDGAASQNFQPFNLSTFQRVTELWLFNGTKDERRYKAKFVGVKTREELIRDYGYPAKGKAQDADNSNERDSEEGVNQWIRRAV